MRHKYDTRGLVLTRAHTGEANTFVMLITTDLGLVRARAQSLRKSGAKLSSGLATFAESTVVLVRGKEGWRVTGAVLEENWFTKLAARDVRERAARVAGLVLRLVQGETQDTDLFTLLRGFFNALATLPTEQHEAAEIVVVLRILSALGLDTGAIPGGHDVYPQELLTGILHDRSRYITRINMGITASGL